MGKGRGWGVRTVPGDRRRWAPTPPSHLLHLGGHTPSQPFPIEGKGSLNLDADTNGGRPNRQNLCAEVLGRNSKMTKGRRRPLGDLGVLGGRKSRRSAIATL